MIPVLTSKRFSVYGKCDVCFHRVGNCGEFDDCSKRDGTFSKCNKCSNLVGTWGKCIDLWISYLMERLD